MPRFTRRKRKTKPKRRRYRGKRQKSNMLINRGPSVVPDRYRTKLVYTLKTQANSSNLVQTVVRGNSVFDPEWAVGGNQPTGFDQLSTLYGRYIVHGCQIKVRAVNLGAGVGKIVVFPTTATSINNIREAIQAPYSKTRMLAPTGSGQSMTYISSYSSTKSIRGITGPLVDDELEALTTANPPKEWYWIVAGSHFDEASIIDQDWEITVVYYVDFFKRLKLSNST